MSSKHTPEWLANEVLDVLGQVLLHKRSVWGTFGRRKHHFEAWWQLEMALALEAWCWSSRAELGYQALVEQSAARIRRAGTRRRENIHKRFDLVVVPELEGEDKPDFKSGPRVWVELKERATWWDRADRAMLQPTNSLLADVHKWRAIDWSDDDVVLVCQVLLWEAPYDESLDSEWLDALAEVARRGECKRVPGGAEPVIEVGYPIPERAAASEVYNVQWARLDAFQVHPA